jgi:hypothetical protein
MLLLASSHVEVLSMFSVLKRLASWPLLLGALSVSGPLTLLFQLRVPDQLSRAMDYTGEPSVFALDAHPYSPQATYELLAAYGEVGRRATIVMHLLFDTLYPVSYTLFFSLFFTLLSRSPAPVPRLWRWAGLLPWVAGGADLLENTGIITMALAYPSRRRSLAQLTSVATGLKWGFVLSSLLLWLAGVLLWSLQRLKRPTSTPSRGW